MVKLLPLLFLTGCGTIYQWERTDPDRSRQTIGPIVVSKEQIENACPTCRDGGCYGCYVVAHKVIYLRTDATRNYLNLCRLPDREPTTTEEHEWCHAKGWIHD